MLQYGKYENSTQDDIMKGHRPKQVEDRVLTGMCLRTIQIAEDEGLQLTSREIHEYISNNTFQFELPEKDKDNMPIFSDHYSYDSLPGIRTTLVYMRRAGYVLKRGEEKPFHFILTDEGRLMAADPWYKYKIKMEYAIKLAQEEVKRLLADDEQVEALAERKRIEKCKTCRDSKPRAQRPRTTRNTVRPIRNIIKFQKKNGEEIEIEFTDDGVVKELQDLKDALVMKGKDPDIASTIMSLQNENVELRKVIKRAGIEIGKLDKQLLRKEMKQDKVLIRNMNRMELSYHYYNQGLFIDGDFMENWKGSIVVVEYSKRLSLDSILHRYYDILSARAEIMTRTDFVSRILEAHEIPDVQIEITEIRDGSIVVDSQWFNAPKTLKL